MGTVKESLKKMGWSSELIDHFVNKEYTSIPVKNFNTIKVSSKDSECTIITETKINSSSDYYID